VPQTQNKRDDASNTGQFRKKYKCNYRNKGHNSWTSEFKHDKKHQQVSTAQENTKEEPLIAY